MPRRPSTSTISKTSGEGAPTSVRGARALRFDFDSVLELLSEQFQDAIRSPAEHLTAGSGPDSFSVLGCGRACRGNLIA